MKTTRRGLFGMLAGLFAGFGAVKAAPVTVSEVIAMTIDLGPSGLDIQTLAAFKWKDGAWEMEPPTDSTFSGKPR